MPEGEPALSDLRNLGPTTQTWLQSIGVHSKRDIERMGPVTIYQMLVNRGFKPTLNALWALYGAVHDIAWNEIPESTKQQLKQQLNEFDC